MAIAWIASQYIDGCDDAASDCREIDSRNYPHFHRQHAQPVLSRPKCLAPFFHGTRCVARMFDWQLD